MQITEEIVPCNKLGCNYAHYSSCVYLNVTCSSCMLSCARVQQEERNQSVLYLGVVY